jgi:hypothetical protein
MATNYRKDRIRFKMKLAVAILPCALAFPVHHADRLFPSSIHEKPLSSLHAFANLFEAPQSFKNIISTPSIAEKFISAWNEKRFGDAMTIVDDEVEFLDTQFPSPFHGKDDLERILRLVSDTSSECLVIDEVVSDLEKSKIGILFHTENDRQKGKIGNACFDIDQFTGLITSVFLTKESSKSGESNLKVLKAASQIISLTQQSNSSDNDGDEKIVATEQSTKEISPLSKSQVPSSPISLPEQYFAAWNDRDIGKACSVFDENVEYDDTAFPAPFVGKVALDKHLNTCVKCFPSSMSFVVDDVIDGGDKLMVRWHAENNGEELPFTIGCSFYRLNKGKIVKGVDVVEPAVFKSRGLSLIAQSILSEPVRCIPLAVWVVYIYVVFFSDWFFGMPATALEQRTWEEVRDLSLNFFYVSPILDLPFAPIVHPMMEGVFNLLLSWAALFAGFLSDERRDKPNLLPMLPTVVGMQFLTSAFLLPYLATRSVEKREQIYLEDLHTVAQVTESRLLGVAMSGVGIGSVFWAIFARVQDFGGWDERFPSFLKLLSIDRVGSSFLVDLGIFAMFQGWLVDDDLKRRNMSSDTALANAAKYIPFLGMAAYLTLRDSLPQRECNESN